MSDAEYGLLMLNKALQDLRTLRAFQTLSTVDPRSIDDEIFGFHAQQAVEKSMKAWLSFKRRTFPLTHNLEILSAELRAAGEDPSVLRVSVDLTPFAVQHRYPLLDVVSQPLDRARLLAEVEAIVAHVGAILAMGG